MIHPTLGKEHVPSCSIQVLENFCEEPKRLTENPANVWQNPSMAKLDRWTDCFTIGDITEYHRISRFFRGTSFCNFLAEKLPAKTEVCTSCLLLSCCKPLFSSESHLLVVLVLQLQYESNQQRIDSVDRSCITVLFKTHYKLSFFEKTSTPYKPHPVLISHI